MITRDVVSSIANLETTDALLNCNCTNNAVAVLLDSSANYPEDRQYIIKKTDISANKVPIIPYRKQTFSGYEFHKMTYTITLTGETLTGDGDLPAYVAIIGAVYSLVKTINVPVLTGDTSAQVAEKVRLAFIADAEIGNPDTGLFTVSGSGSNVVLTRNYLEEATTTSLLIYLGGIGMAPSVKVDTTPNKGLILDSIDDYFTIAPINGGWAIVDKRINRLSVATITDTVTAGATLQFVDNSVYSTYTVTKERPFLGDNALNFNADNSIVIRRNGVDQVKGTDVIWYDSTSITFAEDLNAGEKITINS